MTEVERIEAELRRSFEGEAFHGPALAELLADVAAGEAAARPLAAAHSIWEIVRHVIAWENVVRRRLGGEQLEDLPPEEDWPGVSGQSPESWEAVRRSLERENLDLRRAILDFPEARLDERVPGRPFSFYDMLHGLIQHDLYHAGQIALLKKALRVPAGSVIGDSSSFSKGASRGQSPGPRKGGTVPF